MRKVNIELEINTPEDASELRRILNVDKAYGVVYQIQQLMRKYDKYGVSEEIAEASALKDGDDSHVCGLGRAVSLLRQEINEIIESGLDMDDYN